MSVVRLLSLACLLLASGCTIQRVYVGAPLRAELDGNVEVGETTRAQVLSLFGAPNRIFRHGSGDVFVYRYTRRNSDTFALEEPVITQFTLFSYTLVEEREDRLVVIFDARGRVESVGRFQSTEELD